MTTCCVWSFLLSGYTFQVSFIAILSKTVAGHFSGNFNVRNTKLYTCMCSMSKELRQENVLLGKGSRAQVRQWFYGHKHKIVYKSVCSEGCVWTDQCTGSWGMGRGRIVQCTGSYVRGAQVRQAILQQWIKNCIHIHVAWGESSDRLDILSERGSWDGKGCHFVFLASVDIFQFDFWELLTTFEW